MAVNLRVEWQTGTRWIGFWTQLEMPGFSSPECPEVRQSRAAQSALLVVLFLGGVALFLGLRSERPQWAGLLGVAAVLVAIPPAWLATHLFTGTPLPGAAVGIRTTLWALFTWWSYNRHEARAPGVFQFPTPWCRSKLKRDVALGLILAVLALGVIPLTPHAARGSRDRPPWDGIESISGSAPGRWIYAIRAERDQEIRKGLAVEPGDPFFPAWCLFAAASPLAFVLLVTWLLYGSVLARFYQSLEAEGAPCHSADKSPWDNAVDRLINAAAGQNHPHLFLGRHYFLDYPVLLNRKILDEHAHITGGSGGGKTSLGVAPLLSQLIASEDCSVVVLDLKGDRAMLRTAEIEARRSGATFKWFTNRREVSSYVFNPFQQSHIPRLTPNQRTQAVLQGLSLDYGDAYGKSFFSAMNESTLLQILRQTFISSFNDLARALDHLEDFGINPKVAGKDSRHLSALVERLCESFPLNQTQRSLADRRSVWDARIDAPDILRNRQVAYFYLSSPEESMSAPAIAKLLVYSLFTAAANRRPGEDKQVYLFIDEFQRVTSQSVKLVLEQGRSLGLSFIVVHQSSEQLAVSDRALLQVVDECTAFKQVFRAQDDREVQRIMDRSGEARYHTLSWQQDYDQRATRTEDWFGPAAAREGIVLVAEAAGPRLDRNTISELSAAPLASFVSFGVNRGFTQYGGYVTPIRCEYHVSEAEYNDRNRAPWPEAPDETVEVPPAAALNPREKSPGDAASDDVVGSLVKAFGEIIRRQNLQDPPR